MFNAEFDMAIKSLIPETLLILGLLGSLLIGALAYFAYRADLRARRMEMEFNRLKANEEFHDVILKHLPVGIYITDVEGKCTFLNEYGCSLMGVRMEEILGDQWTRYIHPDDMPEMFERWLESVKRLDEFYYEFRFQPNQKIKPDNRFYVHSIPLKNPQGQVKGYAGTLIDITRIKEIETALKSSYAQIERAQSISKVMVCHVGLDGTWLKVTQSLCELLGYAESELIGQPFKEATHPEDFLRDWNQCEQLIAGTIKSFELEKRYIRKDWTIVWVYLNCSIVEDAQGRPLHFLTHIINIDDKKRMLELRDSRDRLRQLALGIQSAQEDERTRIAREIHDELGQSLTLARMGLAPIEERAVLMEPELSQKFLALYKLIDDSMSSMRRIISGLRPPVLDDFGLSAALDWHAGEFQSQTGIECELNLDVSSTNLGADQELTLFRIYQEAMTNIMRHAQAAKVAIAFRKVGDFLELEINDDGCGIPELSIYNSRSSGIMGMYERASLWGWELAVQGKPNKGTDVLVRICVNAEIR